MEGKPRRSAVLRTLVIEVIQIVQDNLVDPADDLSEQSSIMTATGVWLDDIGERLKLPRPFADSTETTWFGFDGSDGVGFDQAPFYPGVDAQVPIADESYRSMLYARGGQLITDCSIPDLDRVLNLAFATGNYIDNGNMTIDVILDDSLADDIIKIIVESGLITKPAGVGINNILIKHLDGTFGFDGNGVGFDQAPFARNYTEI